ncbi:zinc-dependent alcohol dehydrogenase family protein [Microbacterium sulfonylureivorans]|uniref:zinc-dependent alcohol dehydrogenase family protein n=1 Tax=Microbacterium sulfonylureivorans TaxID=2486854 RepID=UPI000FD7C3BC|nr:zinc-dependent alcohol dehydrogenase family protein [Microbacterium sulfonylureivorans]
MKAWITGDVAGAFRETDRPIPTPSADEVLVRVEACGVCRTDLHVIDHELPPHRPAVVPGHQVVGTISSTGPGVLHLRPGDRVGIAWLRRTCGSCLWCRQGKENLCPSSQYTGWDADGGFAEYATVPEPFAYALPSNTAPAEIAPLLCAGIIGYRALVRANLPPGGRLGIYGFGSSAHITAKLAMAAGAEVYAMTRGATNRALASAMGAVFVGGATARPPVALDSAIIFAPAGELVPLALQATDRGGTVVLAGIDMSDIPAMEYRPNLFNERDLRTVTANTRADGAAFLRLAATLDLSPTITRFPFVEAAAAVAALRSGHASGSLVLEIG